MEQWEPDEDEQSEPADDELRALEAQSDAAETDVEGDDSRWLLELSARGHVETYVFRPRDLSSGRIERVLMGAEKIEAA